MFVKTLAVIWAASFLAGLIVYSIKIAKMAKAGENPLGKKLAGMARKKG